MSVTCRAGSWLPLEARPRVHGGGEVHVASVCVCVGACVSVCGGFVPTYNTALVRTNTADVSEFLRSDPVFRAPATTRGVHSAQSTEHVTSRVTVQIGYRSPFYFPSESTWGSLNYHAALAHAASVRSSAQSSHAPPGPRLQSFAEGRSEHRYARGTTHRQHSPRDPPPHAAVYACSKDTTFKPSPPPAGGL